ncbi:FHF complex subunit HOOK interacting protein 1A isoform X1, partial [Tachysurus ichikawai]
VLASVKNQIEQLAVRQKGFPELLLAAQQCLLARETSLTAQDSPSAGKHVKIRSVQPKIVVPPNRTEVYAAVVFTEFLKELAAITQEHSILSYIPMEE